MRPIRATYQAVVDFCCPYSGTFRLLADAAVRHGKDGGHLADLRFCGRGQPIANIKLWLIFSAKCDRQIDISRAEMCSPGQHGFGKTAGQRRFGRARLLLKSTTHPPLPHSPLSPLPPLLYRYHRKSAPAAQHPPTGERRHLSRPLSPAMSPCSLTAPTDHPLSITA